MGHTLLDAIFLRKPIAAGAGGAVMNEFFSSLVATLGSLKWGDVSLLVGFITAWLLFELTERRRIRLAQRELRRALLAELENAEVLVSSIVGKYARLCKSKEDVALVASEIRWHLDAGRQRFADLGIISDLRPIPPEFRSLSDDQLIKLLSSIKETIGTTIIMPVVERALAGQTLGFRAIQIQAISMVRWQTHLLEQDVESMKEMLRLTFTVTDEQNHKTVVENHHGRTESYARRAQTLLRAIRAALQLLR